MTSGRPHRRAWGAAIVMVAGTFTSQLLLLVSGILSARMLGVEGRGHVALVMAVGGMASVLTFGSLLPAGITLELARRGVTARDGLRRMFPRWSALACIPAVLAGAGVTVVLAETAFALLLGVLTAVSALQAMAFRVLIGAMQGELASVHRMFVAALIAPVLSTSLLVTAFVLGWEWDVVDLLTAQASMWTIGLLLAAMFLRKPRRDPADALDSRELWRRGRANYVGTMAPIDGLGLDRTLTGTLLGSVSLGLYAAAGAVANLPGLVGQAVGVLLLPRLSAQTSVSAQRRIIGRWLVIGSIATAAIVVPLILAAEVIIRLAFGEEFVPAAEPARWLIAAQGVLGFRRLLITSLQGVRRGGVASIVEFGLTAVAVVGIIVAAMHNSLTGVAVAMLVAGCLSCAVLGLLLVAVLRSNPVVGAGSRVLLVELGGQGHRFYYVRLLVEEALRHGSRVALLTRIDPVTREHLEVHLGELLGRVEVVEVPTPSWSDVESFARGWRPDLTVVPEADHYVLRLLARAGWRAPGELSLVIMRARVPSVGTPLRSAVANVVKALGVTGLLLMPRIRLRVLRGQTWSGGGWWPSVNDPATLLATPHDVSALRARWDLVPGRFWVGVLGAVTENKNVPLVVEAVADVARDHPIGLLVAGRVSPSIQPAVPEFERQLAAAGARFVVQDRLLTDAELDAAVVAIDCMALAYGHNGPSGTFGKALLAGTRVVAAGSSALRRDCLVAPDLSTWVPLDAAAVAGAIRKAITTPPAAPMAVAGGEAFAAAVLGTGEIGPTVTGPEVGSAESLLVAEENAIRLQDPTV